MGEVSHQEKIASKQQTLWLVNYIEIGPLVSVHTLYINHRDSSHFWNFRVISCAVFSNEPCFFFLEIYTYARSDLETNDKY